MISRKTIIGINGEVNIPKELREKFNIKNNSALILRKVKNGILIENKSKDIIELLQEIANKPTNNKKLNLHSYEEQLEERWSKCS